MDRAGGGPAAGPVTPRWRRWSWPAVVTLLLAVAVAGLIHSTHRAAPPTRAEQSAALAAQLRCPTCQGLSVADSHSPLAQSMRRIIDEQLAAGQQPAQIKAYFVQRYGDWVLLSPPARGLGWLVWLIPIGALLLGIAVVASLITGWRPPPPLRWGAATAVLGIAVVVVAASQRSPTTPGATQAAPAATSTPEAGGSATSTPESGSTSSTGPTPTGGGTGGVADLSALTQRVQRHPDDVAARLALAAAALQAGKPEITRAQAEAVLAGDASNPDALLLRGLAPERPGDPAATAALRRFIAVAPPNHPGLPLARSLVEGAP